MASYFNKIGEESIAVAFKGNRRETVLNELYVPVNIKCS